MKIVNFGIAIIFLGIIKKISTTGKKIKVKYRISKPIEFESENFENLKFLEIKKKQREFYEKSNKDCYKKDCEIKEDEKNNEYEKEIQFKVNNDLMNKGSFKKRKEASLINTSINSPIQTNNGDKLNGSPLKDIGILFDYQKGFLQDTIYDEGLPLSLNSQKGFLQESPK